MSEDTHIEINAAPVIVERHPLLAVGAGQNERRLPDEAVVPYCDHLGARLGWLGATLDTEQQAGRMSRAASQASRAFLHEIRATLMVMALKHGRQLLDVEPMPLTVDPTESGMPTIKDFWALSEDRDRAQNQLTLIPAREDLITRALDAIYASQRPVKQQILWLQRAYMERLAATPIVTDFRQLEPVPISSAGDKLYAVSWTGIIRSLNLFECVTLHFVERGGWHVTGGVGQLHSLIDSVASGRHTLPEMLGLMNEAAWIVPQTLERVTIGPYQHEWTQNDEFVQRAFDAAVDPYPFLLRATIERAATTKAAQRSRMDALLGREPMESGPAIKARVLLVPLAIKQLLGDVDEYDQACAVYGVTHDGDLVS